LVRCDARLAQQALGNLVQNAIGYADAGGHVVVLLEKAREGRFALTVVDDGPGVPPAELPRLGDRSFRSKEARQRDPRGSGLGLAITNEICTHYGWTLRFSSVQPRGLHVSIEGRLC